MPAGMWEVPAAPKSALRPVPGRAGHVWRAPFQAGLSGPWKRIGVSRATFEHNFSAPHHDSVESFTDYCLPPEKITPVTR